MKNVKGNKQGNTVAKQAMNAKAKAALQQQGANIVKQVVDSGDSVAALYFKLIGRKLIELDAIHEGWAQGWKDALERLKKDCKEWAGRNEASEGGAYSKQAQVYYNKKSEGEAVFKMLRTIGEMPADNKKRKTILKDLAAIETAPRRYDTLVMYARHLNNPAKKGDKPNAEGVAAKRARKAWANKTGEQVKKIKDALRFANLAGLLALADFIDDRIKLLKKREPAQVMPINKGTKQHAKLVNKLRRAA